jgi:hypothetical protein
LASTGPMRTERRYLKRIGCQTFCTLSISGVAGARVLPHRRSGIAENVVPNPKLPLQHVVGGRLRVGAAVHGYLPRLSAEYPRDHQPTRRSTFATACGAHFPPRVVPMPRPLSAAAICRSVFGPAAWASRMAGATLSAKASAPAEWFALAIVWVAVWPQWWDSGRSRGRASGQSRSLILAALASLIPIVFRCRAPSGRCKASRGLDRLVYPCHIELGN